MKKKAGKRAAGEGLLRKRSDGRWEARMPTKIDPLTGKQKFKSFYGHSQAEAKAKRDEYLTAVRTDTYVEPKKTLLGDYMKKWLELYVQPRIKESTYSKYLFNMNKHIIPELGKAELQKIDVDMLQKFYNEKAKSLSTSVIAILHQLINGCLKHAVKQREILNNPAQLTERPRVRYKEVKPFTKEELQKFLDVAKDDQFNNLFVLDLHTGLRKGELLALQWKDIDFKKGVLHVERSIGRIGKPGEKGTKIVVSSTKTEAGKRDIPFSGEIIQLLKAHKATQNERKLALGQLYTDKDYVFDNGYGKPVEARWFHSKLKMLLKKAGLREDIRIHTIRHTFGTMLAQAGENPKNLQELLGHSDIRTTLGTYVHSSLEDKKRAVDLLASIIKG